MLSYLEEGALLCAHPLLPLWMRSLVEDGINPDARLRVIPVAVSYYSSSQWGRLLSSPLRFSFYTPPSAFPSP